MSPLGAAHASETAVKIVAHVVVAFLTAAHGPATVVGLPGNRKLTLMCLSHAPLCALPELLFVELVLYHSAPL